MNWTAVLFIINKHQINIKVNQIFCNFNQSIKTLIVYLLKGLNKLKILLLIRILIECYYIYFLYYVKI